MPGTSAFVTGGTGFIGRNLLDRLVERGWSITALRRRGTSVADLEDLPISFVEGDVLDLPSLMSGIPEGVDVVFHVAGDTSLWFRGNALQTRVNVEGTANVVRAAMERTDGRLVYTSTWNVYGLWNEVLSEEGPQEGRTSWINYDRSKALAEDEVRRGVDQGLQGVIVNPAHVIGPYDRKNWARMVVMTWNGTLPGIPPGSGVFCDAAAVADAHLAAAEKGALGENYLLGGADASFMEVFQTIGELLDRPVPSRPIPAWLFRLIGGAFDLKSVFTRREPEVTREAARMVTLRPRIASDKAMRALGYRSPPLRTMLTSCIDWLDKEGVLVTPSGRPRLSESTKSERGSGDQTPGRRT